MAAQDTIKALDDDVISRAGAVVRYMESLGLPPERLAAAGYADTRPVVDNSTRQGRAKNRRVEIVVLRSHGDELPVSF